jgi:hypothetical protein
MKRRIKFKESEPLSAAAPSYPNQLGYIRAGKKADKVAAQDEKEKEKNAFVVKRRSPLSISAIRPLHPLLAGILKEDISFDRSDSPSGRVTVREGKERLLSEKEIEELLENLQNPEKVESYNTAPKKRKYQDQKRAIGLYVVDVCIDLERLFSVSLDSVEPEIYSEIADKLKTQGWRAGKNSYGPCLVCPADKREKWIPAIANAVINWRISSNQARTFGLMETLAVALSPNAQYVAGAIRARLKDQEDVDKPQAIPVLDKNAKAELFVALPAEGYIASDIEAKADALTGAENCIIIIQMLQSYDYQTQITA